MTTTLLIDADTLAYKCAVVNEYNHDFNGTICRGADLDQAFEDFCDDIDGLKIGLGATAVRIALTGPENFRKAVLPSYKSKRGPKPICLGELKDRIIAERGGVIKPGIEADDVVGIWATHPTLIKGPKIVVSVDKDLKTVPCTYTNGTIDPVQITTKEANYNFLTQVLTGDITDGYTGIPKVGPVKAKEILGELSDFAARPGWQRVVEAYEKRGLTADDALVQARVARILRYQDYNFKTKEPILWTPPSTP